MQEKTKTQADRQMIKKLFNIDPIDWARYPDGSLAFIAPSGKKSTISLRMIDVVKKDTAADKASKKAAAKKSKSKKSKPVDLNAEKDGAPGAAAK